MHGYEIRRRAEAMNLKPWGDVAVGALYGTIRRMADEGLVQELRTEREGRRPPRQVYELTTRGHEELVALREAALSQVALDADPLDVALGAAHDVDPDRVRELIHRRRQQLEELRERLRAEYARRRAKGDLHVSGAAVFEHWEHRIDAELRWHDRLVELLEQPLGEIAGGPPGSAAESAG